MSLQKMRLQDYKEPNYWIKKTELTFELNENKTKVISKLHFEKNEAYTEDLPLILDGNGLETVKVSLNGKELTASDYSMDKETLTVKNPGKSGVFSTEVFIYPSKNTSLMGLYSSGGKMVTQCEAEGFRNMTWFSDRPDILSTYLVTLIADKKQFPNLISNGNAVERKDLENGKHSVVWEDPVPKPSYIFALGAFDLPRHEAKYKTLSGKEVDIHLYTEPENLKETEFALEQVIKSFEWEEKNYGLEYDLDLFQIMAVDDFNFGAMENKGLNIFNSSVLLGSQNTTDDSGLIRISRIIAHEYFHNWSGNRVTLKNWFQLTLKEGLTMLRDQHFGEDTFSKNVEFIDFVKTMRTKQFSQDASPAAHPALPQEVSSIDNFYSATIYDKGQAILHMLFNLLGRDVWYKSLKTYFKRFDGQAITVDDFLATVSEVSGKNLEQFKTWYTQSGTPKVVAKEAWNENTKELTVTLSQETAPTADQSEKQVLHMPFIVGLVNPETGAAENITVSGENFGKQATLDFTQKEQSWVFAKLSQRPIVSYFRGFSAPINLEIPTSQENLEKQISLDSDGFNRWDAVQTLMNREFHSLYKGNTPSSAVVNALLSVVKNDALSYEEKGSLLSYPTAKGFITQFKQLNIDAFVPALKSLRKSISEVLTPSLKELYLELKKTSKREAFDNEGIAIRSLMETCLNWCQHTDVDWVVNQAQDIIGTSENMSLVLSAIRILAADENGNSYQTALDSFEKKWSSTPTVFVTWIDLHFGFKGEKLINTLNNTVQKHSKFSIKTPNHVKEIIRNYIENIEDFHAKDGSGYNFVFNFLKDYFKVNRETANRMLGLATESYFSLDEGRQTYIKAHATEIYNSKDCHKATQEVIEKIVNA